MIEHLFDYFTYICYNILTINYKCITIGNNNHK